MQQIKTKRIDYIDNLKAVLIFLVVFGHLLESYINTSVEIKYIYILIYAFHIPFFAFASGYFSNKNISYKKIGKYILLYLFLQCIMAITHFITNGFFDINWLISPSWMLWYLLSLACWWLLLKLIKNVKWYTIAIAFVIALLTGFIPQIGEPFSISRTITIFPFFLIGVYLKQNPQPYIKIKSVIKYILPITTVAILIVLYTQLEIISVTDFYYKLPYTFNFQVLYRFILFIVAILLSLQVAVLIPTKKNVLLSALGQQTLSIYILHKFALELLKSFTLTLNPYLIIIISLITAFLLCYIFSRPKLNINYILK